MLIPESSPRSSPQHGGYQTQEDGPRRAVASSDRGRLFMPFAALEGYEGMIAEVEEDVAACP